MQELTDKNLGKNSRNFTKFMYKTKNHVKIAVTLPELGIKQKIM